MMGPLGPMLGRHAEERSTPNLQSVTARRGELIINALRGPATGARSGYLAGHLLPGSKDDVLEPVGEHAEYRNGDGQHEYVLEDALA